MTQGPLSALGAGAGMRPIVFAGVGAVTLTEIACLVMYLVSEPAPATWVRRARRCRIAASGGAFCPRAHTRARARAAFWFFLPPLSMRAARV